MYDNNRLMSLEELKSIVDNFDIDFVNHELEELPKLWDQHREYITELEKEYSETKDAKKLAELDSYKVYEAGYDELIMEYKNDKFVYELIKNYYDVCNKISQYSAENGSIQRDKIESEYNDKKVLFDNFLKRYKVTMVKKVIEPIQAEKKYDNDLEYVGNESLDGNIFEVKNSENVEGNGYRHFFGYNDPLKKKIIDNLSEEEKEFLKSLGKEQRDLYYYFLNDNELEIIKKYINAGHIAERFDIYSKVRNQYDNNSRLNCLTNLLTGFSKKDDYGSLKDKLVNYYLKENNLDENEWGYRFSAYDEVDKWLKNAGLYYNASLLDSDDENYGTTSNSNEEFEFPDVNLVDDTNLSSNDITSNSGYESIVPDMVSDDYLYGILGDDTKVSYDDNLDINKQASNGPSDSSEPKLDEDDKNDVQFYYTDNKTLNDIKRNLRKIKTEKKRIAIKKVRKPINKKKIIRGLIAASLAIVTALSTVSIFNMFKNNVVDEPNEFAGKIVVSKIEDKIDQPDEFDGNIVVNKVEDDNSTITDTDTSDYNDSIDEETKNNIINNINKIMKEKYEKSKEEKKNDGVSKDSNYIDIGDSVTISDDKIYDNVYSAANKTEEAPAYHETDKVRNVYGILLTKDGDSYYSVNQDEVNNLRNQGWVDASAVIVNEGGFEGAEPIDNLIEVDNNIGGKHI